MHVRTAVLANLLSFFVAAPAFAQTFDLTERAGATSDAGVLTIIGAPQNRSLVGLMSPARIHDERGYYISGGRYDAGFAYQRQHRTTIEDDAPSPTTPDMMMFVLGASVGITEALEVGAMLPSLVIASEVGMTRVASFPIWATYAFDLDDFEVGLKVSGLVGLGGFDSGLGAGIPFVFSRSNFTLDSGFFVNSMSNATNSDSGARFDILWPVRPTWHVGEHLFVGLDSGLYVRGAAADESDPVVPLGTFLGFQTSGVQRTRFVAALNFDNAFLLNAPEGVTATQFEAYRFSLGIETAVDL